MKKKIAILVMCAVSAAMAQTGNKKKATAPAVAGQLTIPKDAKANPDGSYSWTDKQGKHWVFRNTPFGVMKALDTPQSGEAPGAASLPPGLKVIDAGDTVKFERTTPFGITKWEKKKADLTGDEQSYLDLSKETGAR